MNKHFTQAKHNEKFHESICAQFSEIYFDWKITVVFYIAIHYLRALATQRNIDIGSTHREIENNVKPTSHTTKMPITQSAWNNYNVLQQYSRTARYTGIIDEETFEALKKLDYDHSISCLKDFKKYVFGFLPTES